MTTLKNEQKSEARSIASEGREVRSITSEGSEVRSEGRGVRSIVSEGIVLPLDNVDTDQIIPARFLTTVSRDGLGKALFYDWRYEENGELNPNSPFNSIASDKTSPVGASAGNSKAPQKSILITGDNFGCGSSREHASWALLDFGIRAVISSRFADIFRSNAQKNGLVLVELSPEDINVLSSLGLPIQINVESMTVQCGEGFVRNFVMDEFDHYKILNGVDELDYLLECRSEISDYENKKTIDRDNI